MDIIFLPRVYETKFLKTMLEEEDVTRAKERFSETKALAYVPAEHKSLELIIK